MRVELNGVGDLERRAPLLSVALLATVAAADRFSGYEYGFSLFYLLPILLMGWARGTRAGLVIAVGAALTWLVVDRLQPEHFSTTYAAYWNAAIRLGTFSVTALLVGHLRREVGAARTDILTGLPNRRAFVEAMEAEIARARRYKRGFSVLYLDADGFKRLNDTQGHQAGNEALRATAQVLRASLRDTDLAARLGGDEFAVLLPETGASEASGLTRRLEQALRTALVAKGFDLGFSVGTASYEHDVPASVAAALSAADESMYAVKRSRKEGPRTPEK